METDRSAPSSEQPENPRRGRTPRPGKRWLLVLLGLVVSGGIVVAVLAVLVFRSPGPPLPLQIITDVPLPGPVLSCVRSWQVK